MFEENKPNFMDDILGPEQTPGPIEDKAPENTAAAQPEDKAPEKSKEEPEKQNYVPHSVLHEERERRKELQRQAAEEKSRNDRLEERQNKLFEALMAKSSPPKEEEYVDPLTRLENEVKSVKDVIHKTQTQADEENKKASEEQQLVNRYLGSIDAYSKEAPDFADARNFVIAEREKELRLLGYTQQEIAHDIRELEKSIVTRAYRDEINPAKRIHELAKARGYKAKTDDKIENIDKGLKASKSLGSAGAKGDSESLESLSAADLSDMSDEEFAAFFSKIERQAKRK